MSIKRICICAVQLPFIRGGAEVLVESLRRELDKRGFETEIVTLPFTERPKIALLKNCLAWRFIDLTEIVGKPIDLVIATKFPSYLVKHPNKITWLLHQYRAAYDLYGTVYGQFKGRDLSGIREIVTGIDNRILPESRRVFTISENTAERLAKYNGIVGEPLYPPPQHLGLYHCDSYGDYVLSVGRLERVKRVDMLVRAMQYCHSSARCLIAGSGPEREALEALAEKIGVSDRVGFLGFVSEEELIRLYAECFAVYFAPFDEDYGYVTLEAFLSYKPVLAAEDSGGVLEFVRDGHNGYVVPSDEAMAQRLGERIDYLYGHRELCAELGRNGHEMVKDITWDNVIEKLTAEG